MLLPEESFSLEHCYTLYLLGFLSTLSIILIYENATECNLVFFVSKNNLYLFKIIVPFYFLFLPPVDGQIGETTFSLKILTDYFYFY